MKKLARFIKKIRRAITMAANTNQRHSELVYMIDDATNKTRYSTLRQLYEYLHITCTKRGTRTELFNDKQLIVSLTTYGRHIDDVYIVIESLMQQSLKPNRIILWLAKEEFNNDTIPTTLQNLIPRGLEIKYCDDIKSYKKLIPSLELYPDDIIITVDDDAIYPTNFIDKLYSQHLLFPKNVICSIARQIKYSTNGAPRPYSEWDYTPSPTNKSIISHSILPIGFAGILYPPHSLHSDVCNRKEFMELAPIGDDLWFKIMAIRANTKSCTIPLNHAVTDWIIQAPHNTAETPLKQINTNGYNDTQFGRLINRYGIQKYDFDLIVGTAERITPELQMQDVESYILFLKHKFAYEIALNCIKPSYKVLEIGCGDGYGSAILGQSKASITAIDVDEESVKYAQKKYKYSNIDFSVYDGHTITLPDHTFDVIVSFQVIEHVTNVEEYLNNIKRLLAPDGVFLITTPCRNYRLSPSQKPWNPFHLREYDSSALSHEAKSIFPGAIVYSITATEEVTNIEKERCRPMRDDYNHNYHYIYHRANFIDYYSTQDFIVSNKSIDDGLDLLLTNKYLSLSNK